MKPQDIIEPTWMICIENFLFDDKIEATKGRLYLFRKTRRYYEFTDNSNDKHELNSTELSIYFSIATQEEIKAAGISKPEPIDLINSPEHYKKGGIETIDFIQAKLTPEEFKGYLKGNAIKYLSRATMKGNEADDYAKSQWYINRLNSK